MLLKDLSADAAVTRILDTTLHTYALYLHIFTHGVKFNLSIKRIFDRNKKKMIYINLYFTPEILARSSHWLEKL